MRNCFLIFLLLSTASNASFLSKPFQLRSSVFKPGVEIPKRYTGEGEDLSPPLQWWGVPDKTKEFALICDDPDAPSGTWVHWVAYKIQTSTTSLPEGWEKMGQVIAISGKNSWNTFGYRGPLPPPGSGWHHYSFKIYALDIELPNNPGLTKQQLLSAMQGHVLKEAQLIGKYKR